MMKSSNPFLKITAAVLGGILGFAAVEAMFKAGRTKSSLEASLAQEANVLNQKLPLMVDSETRFDKATAGPGAQLNYTYTLPNQIKSEVDVPMFTKTLQQNIINNYKTNSQMSGLRGFNVKLDYQYKDKHGELVAEFAVSPKDF